MAQPLPLRGKYMIVAHREHTLVVSPVIELSEKSPIKEIKLEDAWGTFHDPSLSLAEAESVLADIFPR